MQVGASRWLAGALAAVLVLTFLVTGTTAGAVEEIPDLAEACPEGQVPASPFVDRDGPYREAIDCLAWFGLTEGRTATTYDPAGTTRRAQLSAFVVRILREIDGLELPAPRTPGFADVAGSPHAEVIDILAALDPAVLRGFSDGTFRPNLAVSRGQLASILARADDAVATLVDGYEPLPAATGSAFPDTVGSPHADAIGRVATAGIVLGRNDGSFGTELTATRGQIALMVVRWLDRLVAAGLIERPDGPAAPSVVANVGAGSRSVMPTVDGSHDYLLDAELPGPEDATSVGLFVEEFDDGRISIGNGHDDGRWVRDDLLARAIAIEDPDTGAIVAIVVADLYMLFRPDVNVIRERVLEQLPDEVADRTDIVVASTHNHHGPDTAWDVNHAWFDGMMDQVTDATLEAISSLEPATLQVGATDHWFGMGDTRDPHIIDPSMNTLQATGLDGEVIATLVQWNNHPEVTLGWTPPEDRRADCIAMGEVPDDPDGDWDCTLRNRYFTADYPGHLRDTIEREVGGTAIYLVGALGGLIAPLRVPLWEITDEVGLGDHYTPPEGAVPAGGEQFETFTEGNFRRAAVIGEQAALAALRSLDDGEEIAGPIGLTYDEVEVYTLLSNIGFRHLLVEDEHTGFVSLGHTTPMLYTCPPQGPKDASTCEPDDLASAHDDIIPGPVRTGDHGIIPVAYLQLGPIGMVFMPGEVSSELTIGLPDGWDEHYERWFDEDIELHATGTDYHTTGYVHAQMTDEYRWTVGSANDHVGYILPNSDWRIACVADELAEEGTCALLHALGFMDFPDGVSGETCRSITADPSLLEEYPDPDIALAVAGSCQYGQVFGRSGNHYEETMSGGWDLAEDMMEAVKRLTGGDSSERINPAFPGYWRGFPPPAAE